MIKLSFFFTSTTMNEQKINNYTYRAIDRVKTENIVVVINICNLHSIIFI